MQNTKTRLVRTAPARTRARHHGLRVHCPTLTTVRMACATPTSSDTTQSAWLVGHPSHNTIFKRTRSKCCCTHTDLGAQPVEQRVRLTRCQCRLVHHDASRFVDGHQVLVSIQHLHGRWWRWRRLWSRGKVRGGLRSVALFIRHRHQPLRVLPPGDVRSQLLVRSEPFLAEEALKPFGVPRLAPHVRSWYVQASAQMRNASGG